jgi:bacterioferritin
MGFLGSIAEIRARVRQQIEDGPATLDYQLDRNPVVGVLNEALATEIVYKLRLYFPDETPSTSQAGEAK